MKLHGRHENIWFSTYLEDDNVAQGVFDIVEHCKTQDEVHDILIADGYVFLESRQQKRGPPESYYAKDGTGFYINVYILQSMHELTVSLKENSFDTGAELLANWKGFDKVCEMFGDDYQAGA